MNPVMAATGGFTPLPRSPAMHAPRRFFPALFLGFVLAAVPLLAAGQQFGESVIQRGHVQEDLYLGGGSVRVMGQVDGDVSAAGGRGAIEDTVDGGGGRA